MELVQSQLPRLREPNLNYSRVYKDECAYTFQNQEYEGGVYVDLVSWIGFSPKYAEFYAKKTGNIVYLQIFKKRVAKVMTDEEKKEKPTVMDIGVKGGFIDKDSNFDFEYTYTIKLFNKDHWDTFPYPSDDLPTKVSQIAARIIEIDSASKKEQVKALIPKEELFESIYAKELLQFDVSLQLGSSGWKCEKCGIGQNLWLNLTDGTILCGRKETGGNGHASEHYDEVQYPMAVKLGTITPDGSADIYSYAEDRMVLDPYLAKHLAHFGINIQDLVKTDKTVAELELEMINNWDWMRVAEGDKKLEPANGPGYTGLINIGNTCYMNSVLQILFSIPEFIDRFYTRSENIFSNPKRDPPVDFHVQMAKVAVALLSGEHSHPEPQPEPKPEGEEFDRSAFTHFSKNDVKPIMFKSVVGGEHYEFSTARQQDAFEYFLYLMDVMSKAEHVNKTSHLDPGMVFNYKLEDRYQDTVTEAVRYVQRTENSLSMPIALDKMLNKAEVDAYLAKVELEKDTKSDTKVEPIRPHIKLEDCLDQAFAPEYMPDYYSTASQAKVLATKQTFFASFPSYLVIQARKFEISPQGQPKKLDVHLIVPEKLDFAPYIGHGKLPSEVEMPQDAEPPKWNAQVVSELMDMGFGENRAKRMSMAVGANGGAQAALDWIAEHMDDTNLDDPISGPAPSGGPVDEALVAMLMEMTFPREKVVKALQATGNDADRAMEWLFAHQDDMEHDSEPSTPVADEPLYSRRSQYELFAFISHSGNSTTSGHYVCHIKKEGRWVVYNDAKVAYSQDPPKELGYAYFYKQL